MTNHPNRSKKITNQMASINILSAVSNRALVQSSWHGKSEGKEVACLLGSISPNVKSTKDCNGHLMPLWMSEVTVTLFDKLSKDKIYDIGKRYGLLINQWENVSQKQWQNIQIKFLIKTIDDAMEYVPSYAKEQKYWPAIEKACAQAKSAIKSQDNNAAYAAANAAYAAANAAANAAAYAAANAAAYAANAAYAAYAAAYAADAAYAAYAAANAAEKLFTFLLDLIEEEINTMELLI